MMTSATEYCETAEMYYKAGCWEQALAVTAMALDCYPSDGALWEMKGLVLHASRQFDRAMDAFEQATVLKPLSCFAQVGLAGCYLMSGQVDLAREMYQYVASLPDVPDALLPALAAGLMHTGEARLAMEVHRERVRRKPDDAQATFALAHYLNRFGECPGKILPLLRRAFALAPDQPAYRIGLALMLVRYGDIQSAYQIAAELPVDDLTAGCCPHRLRGLIELFQQAGDETRRGDCERKLAGMRHITIP